MLDGYTPIGKLTSDGRPIITDGKGGTLVQSDDGTLVAALFPGGPDIGRSLAGDKPGGAGTAIPQPSTDQVAAAINQPTTNPVAGVLVTSGQQVNEAAAVANQERASELQALRDPWIAERGTTAVATARNTTTGEVQTWIANESNSAVRPPNLTSAEIFKGGAGHAERHSSQH